MTRTTPEAKSSGLSEADEKRLTARARGGDTEALDELFASCRPALFGYIYRMVTHRQDAEDLFQEVQLRAIKDIRKFRGQSRFKTWLFGIATHVCLDMLRQRVRWRRDTQLDAELACRADWFRMAQVKTILAKPDVSFEIREHIAFCFSCVARSLEPESQAVLMLREVVGLTLQEAARILDLSEPRYRHKLAAARRHMQESFEGMCQLVSKTGACWQCRGLRELAPPSNQGEELVQIELGPGLTMTADNLLDSRIDIARRADLEHGASAALHDDFFEVLNHIEQALGEN